MKQSYWTAPAHYNLTEATVISKICKIWQTDITEIKGKRRQRHLVESRALLSWFYVRKKQMRLVEAGKKTNRNHASVIHHIKIVDNLLLYDKEFKEKFNQVIINN